MEILSNKFNIDINKQSNDIVVREILSNNFIININKQDSIIPPINTAPVIQNILVSNITFEGSCTLNYEVIDSENDAITHKLKINTDLYENISPEKIQNSQYRYTVNGLKIGANSLYIQVSDGQNTTTSSQIIVNIPYDSSEITQALKLYSEKLTLLRSAMQSVQNKIAQNKSEIVMDYAKSEIKQLADSIELKVEKNGVISSINQTAEAVKINANKINLNGAVSVTNPTYSDRYIKLEKDYYVGINEDLEKIILGFKSPLTGQSDNAPVISLGHKGVGGYTPYLLIQDYPAVYNPIGSSMAFSEIAYQFSKDNFSSFRFLGNGNVELNTHAYLSVGTYQTGQREELLHIKRENGKGCVGSGKFEAETISTVNMIADNVKSQSSLLLTSNDHDAGVVLYDSSETKCFEPMHGQGGQINCGSPWSPWKGVFSTSTYSSGGVVANVEEAKIFRNIETDDIIDNINFITSARTSSNIQMDVTNIIDTDFVDVDEYQNVSINESELLKLALLEIKKLKQEIEILKGE